MSSMISSNKRKISKERLVYLHSLASAIKENHEQLESDIKNLLREVTVLVPTVHQADGPLQWLGNLENDISRRGKALASVQVSETESEEVTLASAIDLLLDLVDDYTTIFEDKIESVSPYVGDFH